MRVRKLQYFHFSYIILKSLCILSAHNAQKWQNLHRVDKCYLNEHLVCTPSGPCNYKFTLKVMLLWLQFAPRHDDSPSRSWMQANWLWISGYRQAISETLSFSALDVRPWHTPDVRHVALWQFVLNGLKKVLLVAERYFCYCVCLSQSFALGSQVFICPTFHSSSLAGVCVCLFVC